MSGIGLYSPPVVVDEDGWQDPIDAILAWFPDHGYRLLQQGSACLGDNCSGTNNTSSNNGNNSNNSNNSATVSTTGTNATNSSTATSTSAETVNSNNNNNTSGNTTTNSTNDTSSTEKASPNDGQVLRDTFAVYGTALLVITLLFCWVRRRYPRPYTIRKWTTDEKLKTSLAEEQHGFFSWMWMMNDITEDEIMDECGLDALCYLRTLKMGAKIALLGMVNAIWLMPLYKTAPVTSDTDYIHDPIVELTISNVGSGSPRLIATVIAAYTLFGYCMYLILYEFEWFTERRHQYLRRLRSDNYTVYVRNIPPEYRSNAALESFFRQSLGDACQPEAHVRVKLPELTKLVDKRAVVLEQLAHAVEYKQIKRKALTHQTSFVGKVGGIVGVGKNQQVDSIQYFSDELKILNQDIKARIESIEAQLVLMDHEHDKSRATRETMTGEVTLDEGDPLLRKEMHDEEEAHLNATKRSSGMEDDKNESSEYSFQGENLFNKGREASAQTTKFKAAPALADGVKRLSSKAAALIKGGEDGGLYSAGFVSFRKMCTPAALQMVHHATPFQMEVTEAPVPDDIFWANVGREHRDLQVGRLFSLTATATLCLLWTIPMAFFASLSSVEALRAQVGFIDEMITAAPFLGPVLALLAPLLVVVVNGLLPTILEYLSMFEGPVSGSVVQATLFSKLAAFMIIQTFFVNAISGGLMKALAGIIDDPQSIIPLLANSLPAQSTYFIQILFVGTIIMIGMEILRVVPLVLALIRKYVGPNLTERERNKSFMFLRVLRDPSDAKCADNFSQVVFYFMILLVYQVIAPLTSFILWFVFGYVYLAFRHQFVFIYPKLPDSGGRVWTNFISLLITEMLIAEFTIVGLMSLKKATIATPMMFPLIIITFLFSAYVRQQHFRVAEYLPSREALKADIQHKNMDLSFLQDAYVQPQLQEKEAYPEVDVPSYNEAAGQESTDDVYDYASASMDRPSMTPSIDEMITNNKNINNGVV